MWSRLVILVAVSGLFVSSCGFCLFAGPPSIDDQIKFQEGFRKGFMDSCTKNGKSAQMEAYCSCMADNLLNNYTIYELSVKGEDTWSAAQQRFGSLCEKKAEDMYPGGK